MDEWYDILPCLRNKQLLWFAQCNTLFSIVSKRYLQQAQWKKQGLWKLVEKGDADGVKYLVERCEADVYTRKDDALQLASHNGHLDVVRFLVECGADVHAHHGWALRWASWNGHLDVVRFLVEQ